MKFHASVSGTEIYLCLICSEGSRQLKSSIGSAVSTGFKLHSLHFKLTTDPGEIQ